MRATCSGESSSGRPDRPEGVATQYREREPPFCERIQQFGVPPFDRPPTPTDPRSEPAASASQTCTACWGAPTRRPEGAVRRGAGPHSEGGASVCSRWRACCARRQERRRPVGHPGCRGPVQASLARGAAKMCSSERAIGSGQRGRLLCQTEVRVNDRPPRFLATRTNRSSRSAPAITNVARPTSATKNLLGGMSQNAEMIAGSPRIDDNSADAMSVKGST